MTVAELRFLNTVPERLKEISETLNQLLTLLKNSSMEKYTIPSEFTPEGNAFYIMGMVVNAMKEHGLSDEVEEYLTDAKSGDYYHLREVSEKMLERINKM